ncbi:hypothetical protein [Sulfurimonas sp.]
MEIAEIKTRLENSKDFKYWSKEVGIRFDDFKIIDVVNNKVLCGGSNKIGEYCIMILDNDKLQVAYDLTVERSKK